MGTKTRNDNCLDGLQCPLCGSLEPFAIQGHARLFVYDGGCCKLEDPSWDDDAGIQCLSCYGLDTLVPGTLREYTVGDCRVVDAAGAAGDEAVAECSQCGARLEAFLAIKRGWQLEDGLRGGCCGRGVCRASYSGGGD